MPSILQVALDTPLYRLFDYRLPDALGAVQPGSLVEVPFGSTRQIGVALGAAADSAIRDDKLRDVIRVLDDRPTLSPNILRLAQFCADYYHHPLGAILLATLPPRLKNATPFVADTPWLLLTETGRAIGDYKMIRNRNRAHRGTADPRQGAARAARCLAGSAAVARSRACTKAGPPCVRAGGGGLGRLVTRCA